VIRKRATPQHAIDSATRGTPRSIDRSIGLFAFRRRLVDLVPLAPPFHVRSAASPPSSGPENLPTDVPLSRDPHLAIEAECAGAKRIGVNAAAHRTTAARRRCPFNFPLIRPGRHRRQITAARQAALMPAAADASVFSWEDPA